MYACGAKHTTRHTKPATHHFLERRELGVHGEVLVVLLLLGRPAPQPTKRACFDFDCKYRKKSLLQKRKNVASCVCVFFK